MLKNKKNYLIPTVSFLLAIIISALLLYLPICNNNPINFGDALYIAVSGVTTTGMVNVCLVDQFSFWGQLVILISMEIGAFGFLIFISYFWAITNKKIKISDTILINENLNGENLALIKQYSILIFKVMIRIQVLGALLYTLRFVPLFGLLKGIWFSIFHSVSAFSNCGFDLLGNNSFINYNNDIYIQIVTILIMLLGSIGIFTIQDIILNKSKKFRNFKVQTKIILVATFILVIVPTILFKVFEPNISILNSLFTSVTARSTGMSVTTIKDMGIPSIILLIIVMFIGGSPTSTAGGVRVVAITVILATMISTLKGQTETIIFWRKIPDIVIRRAFTIFLVFVIILLITSCIFYIFNDISMINIIFDSVSAITNTGLSVINFNSLNIVGESIIMLLMFIGRVGPLSLVLMFFNGNLGDKCFEYPEENIIL